MSARLKECPFVFDLMSHMRKHPRKAKIIRDGVDRITSLEQKQTKGEHVFQDIQHEMSKLVKVCGHNLGLLTPWLFPAYPADKPLSLLQRPYMFALLSMAGNSIVTFRAGRQVGKCVTGETPILIRTREGVESKIRIDALFDLGKPC